MSFLWSAGPQETWPWPAPCLLPSHSIHSTTLAIILSFLKQATFFFFFTFSPIRAFASAALSTRNALPLDLPKAPPSLYSGLCSGRLSLTADGNNSPSIHAKQHTPNSGLFSLSNLHCSSQYFRLSEIVSRFLMFLGPMRM